MADTDVLRIPVDTRQVDNARESLRLFSAQGEQTDGVVTSLSRSIGRLATAAAAVTIITKALSSFRNFEKELVGVGKATDLAGTDLQNLGKDITAISLSIPVATDELLTLAQSAGQLGIKGSQNIREFTTVIAKLGRSSNLAGEQASNAIARLLTVTGENIDQAGRLASQIVVLGNNFATTEAEIASTAGEVSRATSVFKIGSGSVVALAATMAQIGVSAELAGSATGRTFRAIDAVIREGGDSLERLSKLTGQTGKQLEKTFGRSKITVFQQFLQGLEKIADTGGDTTAVLASFGLKGEEILKVIPSLALASDELARSLRLVGEEAKNVTSLNDEFDRTLDTLDSSIKLLGNTFDAVLIKIGGFLSEFLRLKEASKSVRQALVLMFDLPESSSMIKEKIAEVQDALAEAQQPGFFEKLFGTGITAQRKADVDRLTSSLFLLNEKLKTLENNSDTASKATKNLQNEFKTATKSTSEFSDEYVRANELLSLVKPKMTTAALAQIRLTQAQDKMNQSLRRQIREIGLTANELHDLNIARAREAVEIAKTNGASADYIASLKEQVVLLRNRKTVSNAFEAEKKALEENNRLLSTIEDHGRTVFKAFFDSGKSAFETLTQILKDTLIEALFQMTVKKWIFNIVANITGGSGGLLSSIGSAFSSGVAESGSLLGGLGSIASLGKTIVSSFTEGGGIAGGLISSSLGAAIGLSTPTVTTIGTATAAQLAAADAGAGLTSTSFVATEAGAVFGTIASTAFVAGLGAIGGGFLAKITGGNETGGSIGGAGGSAAGFLIGGPVGALIGGILGGLFGGLFGSKKKEQPKLFGSMIRETDGSFRSNIDATRSMSSSVPMARNLLSGQLKIFEGLLKETRLNFSNINKEVRVFRTNFLNADAKSITTSLFKDFGRLISTGVLEGVPPALARVLEEASGGKEIQQAISSWLNARNALENTLRSMVNVGVEIGPAESALIALNLRFIELTASANDLGADLDLVNSAYAASINKLRTDFIGGISTAIQQLSNPNGAALTAIREWRQSAIKEAQALGLGTAQVERLARLKRLQVQKRSSEEAVRARYARSAKAARARAARATITSQARARVAARSEARAEALRKRKEKASGALSGLSRAVNKEKKILSQAAEEISSSIAGISTTIGTLRTSLSEIQNIGKISSPAGFGTALNVLEAALDFSKTGGKLADFGGFTDALDTVTNIDTSLFKTAIDFQRALGQSESLLTALIEESEAQLTTEEMSLDGINSTVNRLDKILIESQKQVNVLLGVDDSVRSVSSALSLLRIRVIQAGGRFVIPSFAVGTNVVPFDTIANVHKGERIIPAADNRQLINNLNGGSGGETAQEIRKLHQELVLLNTAMVLNTSKMKRIMERQDAEGIPPERIPA